MASIEDRIKADPKLLARMLANPGLRSKLPDKYLTPKQLMQRRLNKRLDQPIVPGSTTTERALSHEAQAAMDVRYGPREHLESQALGEEKNRARDTAGFYDQYLAQVAQHSRNVQAIGGVAAQTGLGLQQGITGLAGAGLTGLQNPANADAAARGAQAGDLSGMASNAAAIRQALVGSFIGQQAGQTAAASNYADAQANVVAPGQKLGAQAMSQGRIRKASGDIKATADERGAANFSYRADRRTDEGKNILAGKIANVNADDKAADTAIKAATIYGPGGSKQNSYGFTYDEWGKLPEKTRTAYRTGSNKPAKPASTSGYGAGKTGMNEYGFTYAEWTKLPDAEKTRYRTGAATRAPTKPNGGKDGKGPTWLTPGQSGEGLTQAATLKGYVVKARRGEPFIPGHQKQKPMTREQAREKVRQNSPSLKHPALLDAAVDAVWDKFITAPTVRALITAGYKPSEVARTLGVPTSGQIKADDPKPGRPG